MKAIVVLRAKAGISGTELARRSGMSRENISRIENGHVKPSPEGVKKLAEGLGVSVEEIYLLQEKFDHPKAEADPTLRAQQWLSSRVGSHYLAMEDEEWEAALAGIKSWKIADNTIRRMRREERVLNDLFGDQEALAELPGDLEFPLNQAWTRFPDRVIEVLDATNPRKRKA